MRKDRYYKLQKKKKNKKKSNEEKLVININCIKNPI